MTGLLWGRAISALGDGMWFTLWAIYLTRVVGLPATTVGVGMAVAAGVGLVATIPLGAMADRRDPRAVLVGLAVVEAGAMASYLLVSNFWTFLAATTLFVGLTNGGNAVRAALVTGLVRDAAGRLTALARLRVAQHVGYALGAGVGALVLMADRVEVYSAAITGNAVTFVVLAVLTAFVPTPQPQPLRRHRTRQALLDRPYLAVMGATSVLSLCWGMLSTGLPLWLAGSTELPLALGGVVVIISSVGIAALQIPAGRFARTARQSARTTVVAGVALAASCVLVAATDGLTGAVGVTVLVAAAALHLAGELGYVSANWGLSVALMDERARGVYQGIRQSTTATVQMFAPAAFTIALSALGAAGWLVIAAVFVCAAAPVPALTAWALRARPARGAVPSATATPPPART
jgi:MFS family permease